MCIYIHTYLYIYVYTYIDTYMYTYTHTYIHYIPLYIYTCIYIPPAALRAAMAMRLPKVTVIHLRSVGKCSCDWI